MKKVFLYTLLTVLTLGGLTNCSKDNKNDGPDTTPTPKAADHYFRAKCAQGDINFETYYPGISVDGESTGMMIDMETEMGVEFNGVFPECALPDLEGKTIGFNTEPVGFYFHGKIGNKSFSTKYVDNQPNSKCTFSRAESVGYYLGFPAYELTGTFNCLIDTEDKSDLRELTNGEFNIIVVFQPE